MTVRLRSGRAFGVVLFEVQQVSRRCQHLSFLSKSEDTFLTLNRAANADGRWHGYERCRG